MRGFRTTKASTESRAPSTKTKTKYKGFRTASAPTERDLKFAHGQQKAADRGQMQNQRRG